MLLLNPLNGSSITQCGSEGNPKNLFHCPQPTSNNLSNSKCRVCIVPVRGPQAAWILNHTPPSTELETFTTLPTLGVLTMTQSPIVVLQDRLAASEEEAKALWAESHQRDAVGERGEGPNSDAVLASSVVQLQEEKKALLRAVDELERQLCGAREAGSERVEHVQQLQVAIFDPL